jgi:cell division protein FtsL
MMRINLALFVVLVACALALVSSQHRARKLFTELEQEQAAAKQIEVEWGQLQLEQSTWAMQSRVEKIASGYLQMRVPPPERVRVVPAGAAAPGSAR